MASGDGVAGRVTVHAQRILTDYDWSRADPKFLADAEDFEKRYPPGAELKQRQLLSLTPGDLPALVKIGSYRVIAGSVDHWGAGDRALSKRQADKLGVKAGDRLRINVKQEIALKAIADPDIRESQ